MATQATHVTGTWWRHMPAGADVLDQPPDPPDGRWQRGEIVEGLYLADSPATVGAEWYRWLAEAGLPPMHALPRDLWQWEVALPRVADLSTAARPEGFVLCVFREAREAPGVQPVPPPERFDEPPPPPPGMRT